MKLKSKTVALLVDDMYQVHEFWFPYFRMKEEGATVKVIARQDTHTSKEGIISPRRDLSPRDARAGEFHAVIIPGGYAPDHMRADADILRFVREMHEGGKIVAAICHAAWVPISAGITRGRTMTSYASIKDDVRNSGAEYVDREVVRDGTLITSRKPDDLPAFCREIISALTPA